MAPLRESLVRSGRLWHDPGQAAASRSQPNSVGRDKTISGTGMNLAATPGANGSSTPVFYATTATVQALHGVRGYN
jgi:hypothetical protein